MIIETAKMSDRGQIIIPRDVRRAIGADRNTLFAVSVIGKDTIAMKRIDREALLKDFRKLRAKSVKLKPAHIDKMINEARRT